MSNKSTNYMDSFMDAQKQAIDTMVENTKKFANGNTVLKEQIEKGSEWYNNLMDTQKKFFSNNAQQAEEFKASAQQGSEKVNEFYQKWFAQQMDWAKKMQDLNMNWYNTYAGNMQNANAFAQTNQAYQNLMNGWNNMFSSSKDWMNQYGKFTPSMPDFSNMSQLFNQYYEMLNNNLGSYQKTFANGTMQDSWKNMLDANESYTRFYELWAPMWKSIQEKSFNMDLYKQWMNPASYKEMMDKFFGFVPEETRQYMQQLTGMMQDAYKEMMTNGTSLYGQMKGMTQNIPGMNPGHLFANALNGYNTFYNMLTQSVSPIAKMVTPNEHTKNAAEWADIMNRMMIFHIKNAEMQFMVYVEGMNAMDSIAENIIEKIKKGEEVTSIMALYQEWMKISDKEFVSLFESNEYSKLMAEVSALQLRLKKDIELQTEKMLAPIPVATRSELEDLYKTIYDLKKQVRQLEKMMEVEPMGAVATENPKPAATKTITTKKTK